jgi:predicted anti-sigma-YlaC factor YlaD
VAKNPMTCQEFVDSLPAYRENELTPAERIRANEHLAGCEKCAAYKRGYEQTIELAKADRLGKTEIPEDLVRKVVAARRRS